MGKLKARIMERRREKLVTSVALWRKIEVGGLGWWDLGSPGQP